tara:strand:+ start:10640 stop:11662 length:1023 start_codon:yes stop_codon:yes gene_type:complete
MNNMNHTTPDRPRIVATNLVFPETRSYLEAHSVFVAPEDETPLDLNGVIEAAHNADGLMAFMTDRIDAEFLAACPQLKVIGAALKGYDNIDVDAATRAGVLVTVVTDLLTAPTAELAIGLMLALGRNMLEADIAIRTDGFVGWRPRLYGTGIAGSTVGIVGYGAVGQAIAARLQGFGCRLLACDPVTPPRETGVEPCDMPDLLANSDWVVLATPLTDETVHLINPRSLSRMKHGARLINPARGSLVDEEAVADALDSGRIAGYAADVFACEDWARADRPATISARLTRHGARTVLTPHLGSAVTEVRRRIEYAAAQSIVEALAGRVPADAINAPGECLSC